MAGLSPTVDPSGISAPTFDEILATLQDAYRSLYGADVLLDPDTQDGQLISIFATAIRDANDSAVATYNDFSPSTAQGAGLSSVIKVNGITRNIATNSSCVVRLVGQRGTVIVDGLIGDNLNLGTSWALPSPITIPATGEVFATAFCTALGNVTASTHTLTQILNPQFGWQTADNDLAAVPGAPVESDADLRRRQSRSAALPAQTTLNGIYAAVADVADVQRVAVYENDQGVPDAYGIPGHSIAVCYEGGDSFEVAVAVARKKPPGVQTYGQIPVVVVDQRGVVSTINIQPVLQFAVAAIVQIAPNASFLSSTVPFIQASVAQFYNQLKIGEDGFLTRVYGPASLTTQEAEDSTGFSEAQLDTLGDTFHVINLAQRHENMFSLYAHPILTTAINPFDFLPFYLGAYIAIQLDDGSYFAATVTDYQPDSGYMSFYPPSPRAIPLYAGVFVYGNLSPTGFYTAYYSDPSFIIVTV